MKLQAEIGPETHKIEIKRQNGRVLADVDGRHYDVEVSEPEPNVYLFKHNGRVYEAYVSHGVNALGEVSVSIGTEQFQIRLIDLKRLRGSRSDAAGAEGLAEIRTAMPGKIVRILVETGQVVEKGHGIIVVEAMKMQNELKSPKNGAVKEIRVSVGSTVSSGDVLVIIE